MTATTKKSNASVSNGTSSIVPSKRKAKAPSSPSKAPRRSARGAPQSNPRPLQVLQFLLSDASLKFSRPKDEIEALTSSEEDIRTYGSLSFTPFEELLCAVILSRPISHALGVRSIRTLLNAPYEYKTPQALREAGSDGRRKALDKAKTQHRQKTADELGGLADAVVEVLGTGDDDTALERVREESSKDVEKERAMLKKNIKGLGKTGLDIFFRRVQWMWDEAYPFADPRTLDALGKLGLPTTTDILRKLMIEHWEELKGLDTISAKNEEEKQRKVFVQLLERAVGADLEGNTDIIKAEAEKVP